MGIQEHFIEERLAQVDEDYLRFELENVSKQDKQNIINALSLNYHSNLKLPNPNNSILLYVLGITDEFDFKLGRGYTIDGTPPDIDVDFDALNRDKAIQYMIDRFGQERVAMIGTVGTFKPKSTIKDFFRVITPDINRHGRLPDGSVSPSIAVEIDNLSKLKGEILSLVPKPKHGKEPTLAEMLQESPQLKQSKYAEWLNAATKLEDMIKTEGIHASGLVLSDTPIWETVPVATRKPKETSLIKDDSRRWVTQYLMKDVESLGIIKFDFLGIDNLSIIDLCNRLVFQRRGITFDLNNIPDGDTKSYDLLASGLLTGIFQMETSGSAKDLLTKIKPKSIDEISDITSLNRPGPLEAGYAEQYQTNKESGRPPESMHSKISELLKKSHYTLVYQEQVMLLCMKLAGFSEREADDIRRAMGKKSKEALEPYENRFIEGCIASGISKKETQQLWEDLIGFASYAFNKSHAVAYSYVTYLCAFFKANFPLEFFSALLSVRSKSLQSKDWAAKAPSYIHEAELLGVKILAPSINVATEDFTIDSTQDIIYFGFAAIKGVGVGATRSIMNARRSTPFKDIYDFITRVDLQKVNTKVFEALAHAGCFDRLGYNRNELLEAKEQLYAYPKQELACIEREAEIIEREKENLVAAEYAELKKAAEAEVKLLKKNKQDTTAAELRLETLKLNAVRKKPVLKPLEKPEWPPLEKKPKIRITLQQLVDQQKYIGCFLGKHPANLIYPEATKLAELTEDLLGCVVFICGVIETVKHFTTKAGKKMAFVSISDQTDRGELTIFSSSYEKCHKYLVPGALFAANAKLDELEPTIKLVEKEMQFYKGNNE